jgi:hypothetical protein
LDKPIIYLRLYLTTWQSGPVPHLTTRPAKRLKLPFPGHFGEIIRAWAATKRHPEVKTGILRLKDAQ